MPEEDPILIVRDLKKHFPIRKGVLRRVKGWVRAVDGISFDIPRGSTFGLVGESGCGKTTAARTIMRLLEPTDGRIFFQGRPLHMLRGRRLRAVRRDMQIIFQDPYGSLNPRMTVEAIVGEPLVVHGVAKGREKRRRVRELLERVGLSPAYADHYPHEFSGGQRQRVGIARALALDPDLIVCDEPVSALDVSVQAQIINLLADIQRERGISYLFIAHDLSVVEYLSDRVAVMYLGRIVEKAPSQALYADPRHPYTKMLMESVPATDPDEAGRSLARAGEVPSAVSPPSGCPFHPRCGVAERRCSEEEPALVEVAPGHEVRCFRARGD
ncbi:MAG: ABC transporter ATP-binding protein [Candidatus Brocadiia bacterium]